MRDWLGWLIVALLFAVIIYMLVKAVMSGVIF